MILDGDEFARACFNAHSFLPARCPYKTALLRTAPGHMDLTATDGYAVGRALISSDSITGEPVSIELSRDDLLALDKAGRAAKGEVELSLKAGDGIVATYPYGGAGPVSVMDQTGRGPDLADLWDACDELLAQLEDCPERIAFDPAILMRYGKVKTPKGTSPMLDMAFGSADRPVLAKVGPGFVGAVMPVQRGIAGSCEARGEAFLW
ncbi:hypothetical protein GZL_01380 [Streptomyces sp. 769]|nr:hypothetical protein GZL_01380 [Streptomyces sp. 769]